MNIDPAMLEAARIHKYVMDKVTASIPTGITLRDVDERIETLIIEQGGVPAFKGYKGYPATSCLSRNEVAVHGIPNDDVIQHNDILDIDFGVQVDGWNVDAARTVTFPWPPLSPPLKLVQDTKDMCLTMIESIRPGVTLGELADVGQKFAKSVGLNVMTQYCGHGIGRQIHQDPCINHGYPDSLQPFAVDALRAMYNKTALQVGQVVCIEPVCTHGTTKTKQLEDGWTEVSADNSYVAHHEHTVLVTEDGYEILC